MSSSRDAADGPDLGAIADRITERLAARLASQIAELAAAGFVFGWASAMASSVEDAPHVPGDGASNLDPELWTARRVAEHYGVKANFVYGHANELGCIRLGTGPCARLRFDPQVVRERWSTVGQLPDPRRRVRNSPSSERRTRADSDNRGYELLDFDREP